VLSKRVEKLIVVFEFVQGLWGTFQCAGLPFCCLDIMQGVDERVLGHLQLVAELHHDFCFCVVFVLDFFVIEFFLGCSYLGFQGEG